MKVLPQFSKDIALKVKAGNVVDLDLNLLEKGALLLVDTRDNKGKIETGTIKMIGTTTISVASDFLIIKKVHQVGKVIAIYTSGSTTRVATCDAIELLDGDDGVDLTYTFKYI